ncbi:MAG: DnaD domain protein [Lactobacillus sp.]|jgi:replication initiation and membrane attachment protein|nr:DnaD domain protein [Lactobacillus sp.]
MNGQDVQFSPQDGFLVTHVDYFNDAQQNYLIYLYQPILGPVATALFNTLKTLENPGLIRSQRPMHRVLLDYLNVDLVAIETARRRLEALGLLRTFVSEDQLGKYFVYELYPPLKPDEFFREDLLSLLLWQTIGSKEFDHLKNHFQTHPVTKDLPEITSNFSSVFPEIVQQAVQLPDQVAAAKKQAAQKQHPSVAYTQADLDTFDWDFLQQILSKYQITKAQLDKNKQVIFQLHRYYDIDETNMANLIANTLDIVTNEININKLESLVLAEYTRTVGSPVAMAQPDENTGQAGPTMNASEADQTLIDQAKRLSVYNFLAWCKDKGHGFVGKAETRVLRDLQDRNIFPDPIINMLTYANLLVSPTVTLGYIENVANDWLKNNINTPELAIKQIETKQYSKNGKPDRPTRAKPTGTSQGHQRAAEPIPAWFKRQQAAKKIAQTKRGESK